MKQANGLFENYPYNMNTGIYNGVDTLFHSVKISGVIVMNNECYVDNDFPHFISAYVIDIKGLAHCFANASIFNLNKLRANVKDIAAQNNWEYIDETVNKLYPFGLYEEVNQADMLIKNLLINKVVPAYDKNLHLQAETLQRQAIAIRCLSMYLRHEAGSTHKVLAKELNVTKARIQQLVKIGKQLYFKGQSNVNKEHNDPVFDEAEFKE